MRKIILLYFLIFSVGLCATKMEGRYEGRVEANGDPILWLGDRVVEWDRLNSIFELETRLYGNPTYNSEYYIKLGVVAEDNNYVKLRAGRAGLAEFHEGNISFRQDKNGNGFSTTIFSRGKQYYWWDGSMLKIIDTELDIFKHGNGQGMRFDLWHSKNGSMSYVFSDFSLNDDDDIHLFRYRQSLFNNKVNAGVFFQRKQFQSGKLNDYNQVIAHDFKISSGRYYFVTEFAISDVPSDSVVTKLNNNYQKGDLIKSNIAITSEFRGMRIGNQNSGYWYFTPGIFSYGNTYRNYMGENKSNIYGYWINTYYLVPKRALTLTLNYSRSQKIVPDTIVVFSDALYSKDIIDPTTEIYAEIYIEFVNGFKGKISFNKKDEHWQGKLYKHYDFFSEVSVENRLAKLLGQFKIKDLGETWEKHISGIELSVNFTDKLRFFTRGMIANERVGSRYFIFTQLQYMISGNTELYLEYGPWYLGDEGMMNDDDFVSSGVMSKLLRLIIKGWF